jgi:hypothetical protein
MATGDELLGLLPLAEPRAGFETRVLDRLGLLAPGLPAPSVPGRAVTIPLVAERGLGDRRRPGHRRTSGRRTGAASRPRQLLAAAAVAIAVAGAGIGGWGMRVATAPAGVSAPALTTASLDSPRLVSVGEVYLHRDARHWMFMDVDLDGHGNSTVACQLIGANGQVIPMGPIRLNANGYGWWSSPLSAAVGMPRGVRVVATDGTVLASATFTG